MVSVIDGASMVSVALSSLLIVPVADGAAGDGRGLCAPWCPRPSPARRERLVGLDHRVALDRHLTVCVSPAVPAKCSVVVASA